VAENLGLKTVAVLRKLTRLLVGVLEAAGLVTAEPGARQRVLLLPVPAPDAATVRHAMRQWAAWRAATADEPLEGVLRLVVRHRDRYVRAPWAAALEERRVSVEILPGAAA
jgi:hypothetical protein